MQKQREGVNQLTNNKVAYGIDLAGYSSKGKSQVAEVSRVDDANRCNLIATLIPSSLQQENKGAKLLSNVVKADVQAFRELLKDGGVCAVDVPIDLQGLEEFTSNKKYVWEVTRRPIDNTLGALAPLADRIGAVVARMQLIMESFPTALGKSIFETYPAGSLHLLGVKQQYKGGTALWQNGIWIAKPSSKEDKDKDKANTGLSILLNDLDFVSNDKELIIDDDQFDAIMSAIPLLAHSLLLGSALINHPLISNESLVKAPTGYILCNERYWSKIIIK